MIFCVRATASTRIAPVRRWRPVMPRPDERTLLNISANTPCMLLERFSYESTALIEYTKSIVRGDKYTFQVEFQNPTKWKKMTLLT